MFSSNNGVSHKRVLGTIGFIALVIFMFTTTDHKGEAVTAVEYITMAAIFGTVIEKFNRYNTKESEIEQ
jgi:membrane protein CcdC involved in cytochrome C biogenesis